MPRIRKIVTFVEDGLIDSGIPVDSLYRKVAVAATVSNPYANRHSQDLSEIIDFSVELGTILGDRLTSAMEVPVQSYGKASLVGMNGEIEHGHAFLTTPAANQLREAVGGGKAWIQSTGKQGAPGTTIDVPLAYKDALKVRSHYDTMTVSVHDSPGPNEVLVVIAAANRGRPNFRLGGLRLEDVIGDNGLD
jgi:hypothetical protein